MSQRYGLLTSEIDAAANATGTRITVLSRSYADQRADYVQQALGNYYCDGVAFETNPNYSSISSQNFIQGIQDILSARRKAYILLPPQSWSSGDDYVTDVQSGVSQYLSQSMQFCNPNLYLVLAAYMRQDTGVGFLQQPDYGGSGNTILAAETWLKSYRASLCGR